MLRLVAVISLALTCAGCGNTPAGVWADKMEAMARELASGAEQELELEHDQLEDRAFLAVAVPDTGFDGRGIPDRYREAFERAQPARWQGKSYIVLAEPHRLTASELGLKVERQLQVEKQDGESVAVTIRNRDGVHELVTMR